MTDHPRLQLQHIILHYGRSICDDPKRCEALLRDLCPDNRREINLLVGALREGVAKDLLGAGQGILPPDTVMLRLSQGLHDNLGFAESLALWAVESWALALGVPFTAVKPLLVQRLPEASPPVTAKPVPLTAAEKQFIGWQKIGSKGERLAADASQWAAARDNKSRLMWAVNPSAAANFPNPADEMNWAQANEWVKSLNRKGWCGFQDWRLPTREELETLLLDKRQRQLYIRRDIFPDIPSDTYWVWTSSPYAYNGNDAWIVLFNGGYAYNYNKYHDYYVRVVRSGQ